jgi:hypothetical protein
LGAEHFSVRDRGTRVVLDETIIERVILAGRVSQYTLIERCAFVPETAHSATTKVLFSPDGPFQEKNDPFPLELFSPEKKYHRGSSRL